MRAYPDVGVGFLRWVVHCAHVGHGVLCYGVEVGLWEVEGEREDAEEAAGEGEHRGVVGVEGGAEERCGGVRGPLVAGGGHEGEGWEVLLGIGGVFAHEEAFFEVCGVLGVSRVDGIEERETYRLACWDRACLRERLRNP